MESTLRAVLPRSYRQEVTMAENPLFSHQCSVDLRREFDNFGSAARTVCSRWSRGVYRTSKRPSEPYIIDSRGHPVHSLEMTQTFLTDAEVDQLVAAYEAGATLRELAKQFHIHA